MVERLIARSICRSLLTGPLQELQQGWRVLAIFERACNLVAPSGQVLALVLPEVGDGPLNIVISGHLGVFAAFEPGPPVRIDRTAVHLGELEVRLDRAAVWEPRPNWNELRQLQPPLESRLHQIWDLALLHAPPDSLLVEHITDSDVVTGTAREVAQRLRGVWGRELPDSEQISDPAVQLAGLGSGLTPAGDDFLAGVMIRAWLAHPNPQPFCQAVFDAAAPRTNRLSVAFLRAAARGECNIAWHHLLDALQNGPQEELLEATLAIIAHGHTSGADMLAGFLCLR